MVHPPPSGLCGRDGDADADGLRDSDAELDGLVDALGLRDADGLRDMVYPEHTSTRTGHAVCVMKTKDERRVVMYVQMTKDVVYRPSSR